MIPIYILMQVSIYYIERKGSSLYLIVTSTAQAISMLVSVMRASILLALKRASAPMWWDPSCNSDTIMVPASYSHLLSFVKQLSMCSCFHMYLSCSILVYKEKSYHG